MQCDYCNRPFDNIRALMKHRAAEHAHAMQHDAEVSRSTHAAQAPIDMATLDKIRDECDAAAMADFWSAHWTRYWKLFKAGPPEYMPEGMRAPVSVDKRKGQPSRNRMTTGLKVSARPRRATRVHTCERSLTPGVCIHTVRQGAGSRAARRERRRQELCCGVPCRGRETLQHLQVAEGCKATCRRC